MQITPTSFLHCKHCVVYLSHQHDDWPLFRIWFSVATVTASIVLNLGIFTLLVAGHMALDVIKYRHKHHLAWHWVIIETLREGLIDVFFIVLGLFLGVVFHHSVAIGGLGNLARLEILFLNLFLRVGPRIKIAEHILEVVLYWKHHFEEQFTLHAPLRKSERILLLSTILFGLAIFITPLVSDVSFQEMSMTMAKELTPRLEFGITETMEHLQGGH
jgi:hypothetical protein